MIYLTYLTIPPHSIVGLAVAESAVDWGGGSNSGSRFHPLITSYTIFLLVCGQPSESLVQPKRKAPSPKAHDSSHAMAAPRFVPVDRRSMPRPPNAEKIAWIREDLGDDASLPDFSRKFLEIFGERVRETVPQKTACLKLYSVYARLKVAWVKESDLPPKELVAFERV